MEGGSKPNSERERPETPRKGQRLPMKEVNDPGWWHPAIKALIFHRDRLSNKGGGRRVSNIRGTYSTGPMQSISLPLSAHS